MRLIQRSYLCGTTWLPSIRIDCFAFVEACNRIRNFHMDFYYQTDTYHALIAQFILHVNDQTEFGFKSMFSSAQCLFTLTNLFYRNTIFSVDRKRLLFFILF